MERASRIKTFITILLTGGLLTLGAGCAPVDEAVDDALLPVEQSLGALKKAEELTELKQGVNRGLSFADSNELPVAMVLIDGHDAPEGVELEREFGCSDRIAFTMLSREAATDSIVSDALATLFAAEGETTINDLYNSLAWSELRVDNVFTRDGVTTEVYIEGTFSLGGTCDTPRAKEQIEATVRQFRPNYKIFLNGSESEWRCLGDESGLCE